MTPMTIIERFMMLRVPSRSFAIVRRGVRRQPGPASLHYRPRMVMFALDGRGLLEPFQLDHRTPIRQNRRQFVVLRGGEIALRLHDEVVGGHADFELALLGFHLLLRELARRLRGLHALDVVLHLRGGVGDVGGDLQLDLAELRFHLVRLQPRARIARRPARSCRSDS